MYAFTFLSELNERIALIDMQGDILLCNRCNENSRVKDNMW
jgi:hypothetical protein